MIEQRISVLPVAPSRLSNPSEFAAQADTFLNAMHPLQSELNAIADEINTAIQVVNTALTKADEILSNATLSAQSRIDTENARDVALIAQADITAKHTAINTIIATYQATINQTADTKLTTFNTGIDTKLTNSSSQINALVSAITAAQSDLTAIRTVIDTPYPVDLTALVI